MADIEMRIVDNFDHIISEKGNAYVALRKCVWKPTQELSEAKYDLRKYYTNSAGEETIGKGVSFDDEGADELVRILVDDGRGDTRELIDSLRARKDFEQCYEDSLNNKEEGFDSKNFVDIRSEMLG